MARKRSLPVTDPLPPGSECIVRALPAEPRLAQRLAEMGVLPGSRLRVLRHSPLGGTLEVAAEEGQNLALRAGELAELQCQVVAMPLAAVVPRPGSVYRIHALTGGITFRQRMARLGIEPGGEVEIMSYRPRLSVRPPGSEAVPLGRGEAAKVIVELPATRQGL